MGLVEPGDFNLTLAYNFNRSRVTHVDVITARGQTVNILSNEQIVDVAHLAPAHRIVLTGNWTHDKFSLLARMNYYSSWVDAVDYPIYNAAGYPIGQVFGDKVTFDLDAGYDVTKVPHAVGRRGQPVQHQARPHRPVAEQRDLRVDEQPVRWRAVSAQRRAVRDQRRLLVRPGQGQVLSALRFG